MATVCCCITSQRGVIGSEIKTLSTPTDGPGGKMRQSEGWWENDKHKLPLLQFNRVFVYVGNKLGVVGGVPNAHPPPA